MLAQELFAGFHHNPYLPKCAIKVDFQKAYDTVDWMFLEKVLQSFSFPQMFIKIVMECVTSPKFSIAINGELHGYFTSGRGIRQGDPLSLYLFTLVMEVFSGILNSKARLPAFKFYWRCKPSRLTHLFFADDVLVFVEANLASATLLKEGLQLFLSWSRLNPNANKSELFFSGGSEEVRTQIRLLFGFNEGNSYGKARIWVLAGAKVPWNEVCLPKDEGGLGIRRLLDCNRAALLKHIWILFTNKESLWCKWIHSIFLKNKNFWIVPKPTGPLYNFFADRDIYRSGIPRNSSVSEFFSSEWPQSSVLDTFCSWLLTVSLESGASDCLTWHGHPSGEFSSSKAWEFIRIKGQKVNWSSFIWDPSIAPRYGFLLWLTTLNRLPTQVFLLRHNRIAEGACAFCRRRSDSIDHLFFGCNITGTLANFWASKCNLSWRNGSWHDNLRWAIQVIGGHSFHQRIARFSLSALCHIIWTERNDILFRSKTFFLPAIRNHLNKATKDRGLSFKPVEDSPRNRRIQANWAISASIFDS
ncbi:uncharacterized protein LOC115693418 [Syzygium oleosum]|uniref:uncharacterized protein LOC115693418 n=1 Tax=Syzygium oleosum TaxID=219896 RepID=UPI0011D1AE7C|nr:uncharacterized protein LOC115693418 [Syzygium oleosum]